MHAWTTCRHWRGRHADRPRRSRSKRREVLGRLLLVTFSHSSSGSNKKIVLSRKFPPRFHDTGSLDYYVASEPTADSFYRSSWLELLELEKKKVFLSLKLYLLLQFVSYYSLNFNHLVTRILREIFIYIGIFFPFFDNNRIDVYIIWKNHFWAFVTTRGRERKNLIIEDFWSKKSGIFYIESELNTPMTLAICIHSPANGVVTTWPRQHARINRR